MKDQNTRRRTIKRVVGSCLIFSLVIATFCPIVVWASNTVAESGAESRPAECPTHPSKTSSVVTACQSLTDRFEAVPEHFQLVDSAVLWAPPVEIVLTWIPAPPPRGGALVPIPSDVPLYLLHASLIR